MISGLGICVKSTVSMNKHPSESRIEIIYSPVNILSKSITEVLKPLTSCKVSPIIFETEISQGLLISCWSGDIVITPSFPKQYGSMIELWYVSKFCSWPRTIVSWAKPSDVVTTTTYVSGSKDWNE